ncbi:MAG: Rieske 2Fe-2S domain-containing protein [Planctomycetales bacterium]|nr:Rieske 2Fe-2S domain-containing protein [Planctomycetales bacterium]MBN8624877.1 Rieske 2Fe-2S domain-containing protein [Planctomycetota bacterium]
MDEIPLAPDGPSLRKGANSATVAAAGKHAHPHGPGVLFREPPRRGFLYNAFAAITGALVGLAPLAAGIAVYLDPLRRKKAAASAIPVTTLDAIPDASKGDVLVGLYKIVADRQDAWNTYVNEPVGAVYLVVPKGTKEIKALNATCPHLGCFVDLQQSAAGYSFKCPCHTSAFNGDGTKIEPCVSPRDMDSMECVVKKRITGDQLDVSVVFENFQPGLEEKKRKS